MENILHTPCRRPHIDKAVLGISYQLGSQSKEPCVHTLMIPSLNGSPVLVTLGGEASDLTTDYITNASSHPPILLSQLTPNCCLYPLSLSNDLTIGSPYARNTGYRRTTATKKECSVRELGDVNSAETERELEIASPSLIWLGSEGISQPYIPMGLFSSRRRRRNQT
jgi:hypothetical protein